MFFIYLSILSQIFNHNYMKIIQPSQSAPSHPVILSFCLMHFLYGCYLGCIGPLIPLFAHFTGNQETSYSYLFILISIAEIGSCLLSKIIINRFSPRQLFLFCITMTIMGYCLLTLSFQTAVLSISFTLISLSYIMNTITIISSILMRFISPSYYMTLTGFSFGMGATVGPAIVLLIHQQIFIFFILISIATLFLLYSTKLPQLQRQEQKQIDINQIKLSKKSQLCICALLCIYLIEELGLASWIPTYSIKTHVSNANSAAIYSLIFWTTNSISRLFWLYVSGSVTSLLKWCISSLICSTFICLVLQSYHHYELLCIFAPISSGFILSNFYSFYCSLSVDNGISCSSQNTANFALGGTIGQGLFITAAGYGMQAFGVQSLFVVEFIMAVLSYLIFRQVILSFEDDKLKSQTLLQTELILVSR